MRPAPRWTVPAVAGIVLLLIAWAYWPGLSGPFLFDDYGNLDVLGAYGRIHDLPTLLYYLTSGNADPTGRPVALLSFLLDARDWPAAPWPFKRTNLALHLLNTALLAWVVALLQAGLRRRDPRITVSRWTPLVAAALWGAHPFFVSTVLYVVQREAMLPMTFVLLAIVAWDRAVLRFADGRKGSGWCWGLFGVGAMTLLATLSKANGVLAPLLVGFAYLWCLRPVADAGRRDADRAALWCLGAPTLLLLAYLLLLGWRQWSLPVIYGRDWTLPERLLSEPRALWAYLHRLVLPRAGGGGVYVEDFVASRGWLQPATTLPAVLALLCSIPLAILWRRRFPVLGFAWLFFLAAHLMESSVVPLELYFEHRNYLPAAFLGWPLAHGLLRPGAYPRYRAAFAALLLAAVLLLAHQRALVWGDPQLLGALAAQHEADSPRAQVNAARQDVEHGRLQAGLARIHAALRVHPDSVDVVINAIGLECSADGEVAAGTLQQAQRTLATVRNWNYGLYQWMQAGARDPVLRDCRGFGLPGLVTLVDAAERNPQSKAPSRRRDLWHVRGRIALAQGRPDLALHWFDAALAIDPGADYALVQAAALGEAGAPALGVRHLDGFLHDEATRPAPVGDMAGVHRLVLRHYGYYRDELLYLRRRLDADARAAAAPHSD